MLSHEQQSGGYTQASKAPARVSIQTEVSKTHAAVFVSALTFFCGVLHALLSGHTAAAVGTRGA